jgi:hypothetical protein
MGKYIRPGTIKSFVSFSFLSFLVYHVRVGENVSGRVVAVDSVENAFG